MLLPNREEEELIMKILSQADKKCLSCGNLVKLRTRGNRKSFICSWKSCRQERSVWHNTIFKNLKLKPEHVLLIAKLWLKGMHARHICTFLEISRVSYTKILRKIEDRVVNLFYKTPFLIGGDNIVVEIDESKFGLRKYHRGHRVEGVWVFGAFERTAEKRIFCIPVNDRKKNTLIPIMKSYISKDSIIYSDCWKSYSNVSRHFKSHLTVNHSLGFKNPTTGVHTNTIEGNWGAIKAQTPVRCRTSKLISLYLIRYMLKRNFKENDYFEFIKYFF
jgi:transposase-like protein